MKRVALYLNTNIFFENYQELCNELYFVDKSAMIEKLNARIRTTSKYVCVTRPRRFGKSKVIDMLHATQDKFIFLFDEWDYIFNKQLFEEYQNNFWNF